jgi:hypothetical protein
VAMFSTATPHADVIALLATNELEQRLSAAVLPSPRGILARPPPAFI